MTESPELEEMRRQAGVVYPYLNGALPPIDALENILTAAERLAGENDALRDWGRHLERRVRLYEPHPEVARIRAEHGITPEMMGGDVCHDSRS